MYEKTRQAKLEAEAERKKYAQYGNDAKRIGRGQLVTPEVLRKPEDVRDDPKYQGQTSIMVKFVPLRCVDERTEVDETTLREWILCAAVEEDPYSRRFFNEIHKVQTVIEEIEKNLKMIPKLEFLDEDGKPMAEEKARQERALLFDRYSDEMVIAENNLITAKQHLQNHIDWRRMMGIDFTRGEVDNNTETQTWFFRIYGSADILEIEDLLIRKQNWPGIKLAAGTKNTVPPLPPWAGRGGIPDGSKANLPDYTSRQVNIAGVRIQRVPQGVGLVQELNRASSSLYAEDFHVYYGDFESGKKSGYGIEINDSGVFAGRFLNGFRCGNGRWDLAEGTTIVGNFGCTIPHGVPETTNFQNPYMDGEPTGMMEVRFSDGGYYRGQMTNGRITGQGDYQSALGEVLSGTFQDGMLHGDRNFLQNVAEETYVGSFRQGEVHGKATFMNRKGDSYDGYWDSNLRHGRGICRIKNGGVYRGYYKNGLRHGKGSIEYGLKKNSDKKNRSKYTSVLDMAEETEATLQASIAEELAKKFPKPPEPTASAKDKKSLRKGGESSKGKEEKAHMNRNIKKYSVTDFESIFQGYFLGNTLCNGGSIMNMQIQIPSILARMNKRSMYPITRVIQKEERHMKSADRLIEKYYDMEHHIRAEMLAKKLKIYEQQKHFTKKTMYAEDIYEDNHLPRAIEAKKMLRQERLASMNEDKFMTKKAVIPRLKILNTRPYEELTKAFERVKPDDAELVDREKVNNNLVKVMMSDFEEIKERQRFLKYDLIWQRAESAFVNARRNE